jgi:hypothetical protein
VPSPASGTIDGAPKVTAKATVAKIANLRILTPNFFDIILSFTATNASEWSIPKNIR